jgi:hypothetical protein
MLMPMQAHLGVVVARAREAVAVFLARGWAARLAACALVSLAAVVLLGALVVLLCVLSVIAFVAAVAWLAWLVGRVWRQRPLEPGAQRGSLTLFARARARSLAAREVSGHGESDGLEGLEGCEARAAPWEAGLADVRGSVAALRADLDGWQERLVHEVDRCRRELASQIDALHEPVGRAVPLEQIASPRIGSPKKETSPAGKQPATTASRAVATDASPESHVGAPAEPDLEVVLSEIEAELRLEKIEEREQLLAEREERLNRREHDIAALVTETQSRIG